MRGLRDPSSDIIFQSTGYLPYSPVLDIDERSSTNIIQIYIPYSETSNKYTLIVVLGEKKEHISMR
jgi:hypothetical protein